MKTTTCVAQIQHLLKRLSLKNWASMCVITVWKRDWLCFSNMTKTLIKGAPWLVKIAAFSIFCVQTFTQKRFNWCFADLSIEWRHSIYSYAIGKSIHITLELYFLRHSGWFIISGKKSNLVTRHIGKYEVMCDGFSHTFFSFLQELSKNNQNCNCRKF